MKNKRTYICLKSGPNNNGLIESCGFMHDFDEIANWNCPKCGAKLHLEGTSGKSVADLLLEGFKKEKGE